MGASDTELAVQLCRESLETFGEHCLTILDKAGDKRAFVMNRAQRYVHERLEEQRQRTGKVRALILKGRQQGVSTYIAARFYWRTSLDLGKNAFIVAHEQKATSNLFRMVKRYHENNPLAPSTGATNAQELIFDKADGGYKLATAGSKDVGRSNCAQFLHGSEFAFWDNPESHLAGIGNTIGDADGTEIVLESTANGIGNKFHTLWQEAEKGDCEWIAIFVPWYWQDEYRAPVPRDFTLSEDEQKYRDAYGLDLEQMVWRRNKIRTYGTGYEWLFDQEYPATAPLAFINPAGNPFIPVLLVSQAVNSTFRDAYGPLVVGVDPAGPGKDRTAVAYRRGRVVLRIETYKGLRPMEVAGTVAEIIRDHSPDAVFIDADGLGAGIYDRLRELGHDMVFGVRNAERANDAERYANKRAECWSRLRNWLDDGPVRLPPDLAMQADICGPQIVPPDSHGRVLIEKKELMAKRGVRSPDCADAIALTFAEAVADRELAQQDWAQSANGHTPATPAGY